MEAARANISDWLRRLSEFTLQTERAMVRFMPRLIKLVLFLIIVILSSFRWLPIVCWEMGRVIADNIRKYLISR